MKRAPLVLLCVAVLLARCHDRCGEGYELEDSLCHEVLASPGEAGASSGRAGAESTAAAGGAGVGGAEECNDDTVGSECTTEDDCGCDSDFCAAYPGQSGFCTHTGCDMDPSVCKAAWTCTDLSTFQAGLPAICTPPS
jgi:hypothetical protein